MSSPTTIERLTAADLTLLKRFDGATAELLDSVRMRLRSHPGWQSRMFAGVARLRSRYLRLVRTLEIRLAVADALAKRTTTRPARPRRAKAARGAVVVPFRTREVG
jgi:hypothetical protein